MRYYVYLTNTADFLYEKLPLEAKKTLKIETREKFKEFLNSPDKIWSKTKAAIDSLGFGNLRKLATNLKDVEFGGVINNNWIALYDYPSQIVHSTPMGVAMTLDPNYLQKNLVRSLNYVFCFSFYVFDFISKRCGQKMLPREQYFNNHLMLMRRYKLNEKDRESLSEWMASRAK